MVVELVRYTPDAEELCGEAAAICTNASNPEKSMEHAMDSGHTSILEHAVYTFRVSGLSRAALAQLTRHRIASFDVQSQRYVKMKGCKPIVPETIKKAGFEEAFIGLTDNAMAIYTQMIDAGVPAEDARYITPQAMPTKLVMTMNARELLHFFELRCCNRAQWEIREMADMMLTMCKVVSPRIFWDAGPGCVRGHCLEKKPCGHPRG